MPYKKNDKEYYRQWYEKNREKHMNYCKQKIQCECGHIGIRTGIYVHRKSKKHMKWVESQKLKNKD